MRVITATEASRKFSDLLDAVEAGETVVITRGGVPVAEVHPAARHTGRTLRTALEGLSPPDDKFVSDIGGALAGLVSNDTDPRSGE